MKKILLSLLCIGFAGLFSAQDVITYFEDFQGADVLGEAVVVPFDAEPEDLINYDSDELPPNNDLVPGNWYLGLDVLYSTLEEPGADSNFVAASTSWLAGLLPENRNYLILPEMEITEAAHFLSWKSGAFQGPRYMDGYSVGIVTDIGDPEGSYEKLWSAAQFVADENTWHPDLYGSEYDFTGCAVPAGSVIEQDLSTICYFPAVGNGFDGTGYVHANEFTLDNYLGFQDDDNSNNSYICLLEPHEISLEAYVGQSIRICFRHDSDDDNVLNIDDIMVSSGLDVGVSELAFARYISMYPNPVTDVLNFNFTNEVNDNAVINVIDAKGAVVFSEVINGASLRNAVSIDLNNYSAGLYSVSVTIDNNKTVTDNIVKR